MKKRLNEAGIANELRGNSSFFTRSNGKSRERTEEVGIDTKPIAKNALTKPTKPPTAESTAQSTVQSTDQLIDKSTILGRPKAFYITERQDEELNVAVEKLAKKVKGKVNEKIDRSTVVRLLLEVNKVSDDGTINRLASQLISRLISQLKG